MELLCPSCQRKLTIPDQYAGQLMKCPLCTNTFTAPALAPPPVTPPPPPMVTAPPPPPMMTAPPPMVSPPRQETLPFNYAPPGPAADTSGLPDEGFGLVDIQEPPQVFPPQTTAPPPVTRPAPAPPPGDYSRTSTFFLSANLVVWIAPICLTLLVLLSFTVWYGTDKRQLDTIDSPWHWAWNEAPRVPTMAFKLFLMFTVFLAWPLSIVSLLLQLQLFPLPAGMRGLRPLRPLLVGIPTLVGFLALAWIYLPATFHVFKDFGTISLRMAAALHIWALIGLCLDQWLEKRRQRNLPPPRIEIRW